VDGSTSLMHRRMAAESSTINIFMLRAGRSSGVMGTAGATLNDPARFVYGRTLPIGVKVSR